MTSLAEIQIDEAPDVSTKWKRLVASNSEYKMGFEVPMAEWLDLSHRETMHSLIRKVFQKACDTNAPVLIPKP